MPLKKKENFPKKNIFGFPKGWKDLGRKDPYHKDGDPWSVVTWTKHTFCNTAVHIGKEESGELFEFCPRCLIKLTNPPCKKK